MDQATLRVEGFSGKETPSPRLPLWGPRSWTETGPCGALTVYVYRAARGRPAREGTTERAEGRSREGGNRIVSGH